MSHWPCLLRWPFRHRYELADRVGESVYRCTRCGKERHADTGSDDRPPPLPPEGIPVDILP
jgi:hypothetical protein